MMDVSGFRRILITRTDRIGDVVLSMPAIAALRKAFPKAYIAMAVQPRIPDILWGNNCLDEIMVYDKIVRHKGFFGTLSFIRQLRARKFDAAFILHSTSRINAACFLAGIPRRIGYARGKMDFLLTDRLEDKKRSGERHESEYTLDILRRAGVDAEFSMPRINIREEDEKRMAGVIAGLGLKEKERFVIFHPGASCISKMWPLENFAGLGDVLIKDTGMKVIINLAPAQAHLGEKVRGMMREKPVLFCEPTTLGELAALFKKAALVISNDSGPAHMAAGVGTPVISIFGRNQKGLSPARWRPLGDKSVALHKDIGCVECLAHDCKKGFLCLKAITVEEVAANAKKLL
ncbi:MAG: glycosyltransferase family 9 protein [Candidatus Omnitrophota bacterium]